MKHLTTIFIFLFLYFSGFSNDSLPKVFAANHSDFIDGQLRNEAYLRYAEHQLPGERSAWERKSLQVRETVIKKASILVNHSLPLNIKETGSIKGNGFTVKKITFQTRPGVYATANLYIPDGKGPFPAVINMNGHWREAKLSETIQSVALSLVTNGYVCLAIDAFGAGERSSVHGVYEYHGGNLGASMMNIGESLLGFQVSDNMRGVDLLTSLPYVDADKIGATGASGGGNQTMWLTAIDTRIKASMPVVSVGTFEVYVMHDNCICELPVDALTYTEESGILSLVAPRPIKMCNHTKDDIPTFLPAQMLRTYNNTRSVYKLYGAEKNISYQLTDTSHGYFKADREAMLGWFNLHLKGIGDGNSTQEKPFTIFKEEELMVFPKQQRDANVETIADYCIRTGKQLKNKYLGSASFNINAKKNDLRQMLRINKNAAVAKIFEYTELDGWKRFALQTNDGGLIPVIVLEGRNKAGDYAFITHPKGKKGISTSLIDEYKKKGTGIIIADLLGTGEASSAVADSLDGESTFHTLSRTNLLLGKTVIGEWVKEYGIVIEFMKQKFTVHNITLDGTKETASAVLFYSSLNQHTGTVILRDAPVSYVFDNRESVDFYNMAVHLPGFLNWGDVSLAAALSGRNISFINPLTMSGRALSETQLRTYESEYKKVREVCHQVGSSSFR